jgi:hypothetical protein
MLRRKLPTRCVSLLLPRLNPATHGGFVGDAATKRLPSQHGLFNLDPIQPTAVQRRVVNFEPLGEVPCFRRREGLVQTADSVCVQVVHHEHASWISFSSCSPSSFVSYTRSGALVAL